MVEIVVLLTLVAASYLAVLLFFRIRNRTGNIILKNDENYSYQLGDKLHIRTDGRSFAGISILLYKNFPQIYLDGRHDSTTGPSQTFSNDERINLEGDFNEYFQLFVPKGYQDLALSIITPDVMQVLLESGGNYDIELDGRHLNIISPKNIYKKPAKEKEILEITKRILQQISQKQQSWNKEDEKESASSRLRVKSQQSVRFLGRYYTLQQTVFMILRICALVIGIYGGMLWHKDQQTAQGVISLGVFVFCIPFIVLYEKHRYKL